ncbi:MAG: radical SAM protein [bacterium]
MKAKDISGQVPGGKRENLAEVLPLDTPFLLYVFPIYACNFKCRYCIFSVDKKDRGFISDKTALDLDLYKRCIDEVAEFPKKLKVLRFVGMGEPLLHKDIAKMVEYAVSKNVADTVEIITNGSLLTPKISDDLISAGLSRMIVSLQGVTKEKYKEVSSVDIDFDNFVKNLKYFFDNKKNTTHLYMKIMDTALDNEDDEKRFHEIFGDICDTIAVEHTVPIYPGVDYDKVLGDKDRPVTQFGLPVSEVKICPQPFFTMQINPDGKIVPCFSLDYPEIIGDCNNQSIKEIWNSKKFHNFRHRMLSGAENVCKTCDKCNIIKYRLSPEDVLNHDAERLKQFYNV